MKTQVLYEFHKPLVLEDRPDPTPGAGEAVVRIRACGVCLTDAIITRGGMAVVKLPHVLGHEIAGEVEALGPGTDHEVKVGDPVVVRYYVTCGECDYCRTSRETLCTSLRGRIGVEFTGGYADRIVVPVAQLYGFDRKVPFEEAAVLADAGAASWHALRTQASLARGERVIIVGAGGGLGLIAVQLAIYLGAEVAAVDITDEKLAAAKRSGAQSVARGDEDWVEKLGKADVVLDLVGQPEVILNGIKALRRDGRLILGTFSGPPVSISQYPLATQQLRIIGSRGSYKRELPEVIRLVEQGHLKPVVGATYPLAEANQALSDLAAGKYVGRAALIP